MNDIQIVATLGPSTNDEAVIEAMVRGGMSVARLNFSWGTHDDHRCYVAMVRAVAERLLVTIPIIQDLSGPRIQKGSEHTFDEHTSVITEKDRDDLTAMADQAIEYVALSFVKDKNDILELRKILAGSSMTSKIIAKIERQEALDNLDEIIAAADGIMIARGDLGEAVPIETLPFVKKDILRSCNLAKKPAIVATQMLTSMMNDTDPSRADVSDIASAVLDGASATMLSDETAAGEHPIEAVTVMRKVVNEAQKYSADVTVRF